MEPDSDNPARLWHRYARKCMKQAKWINRSCTFGEFVMDVETTVFMLDQTVNRDRFFEAIDRGLAASELHSLPEAKTFKRAIQKTIAFYAVRQSRTVELTNFHIPETHSSLGDASESEIRWRNAQLVLGAMMNLPKPFSTIDRLILRMKYQGIKQKEIAKRLNVSESTVSNRLNAVRDHIRKQSALMVV